MHRQIKFSSFIDTIMLWTVFAIYNVSAFASLNSETAISGEHLANFTTTTTTTIISSANKLKTLISETTNLSNNAQQQSTEVGKSGGTAPPSYAPVFYVFSFAALVCLAVTLHVLYNEWAKKYSHGNSDELGISRTVDTSNGNGSSGSLIIGGDLIPMTLQGNGNLRLSQSMQQHHHQAQHFSRFDSIPLGTPVQYLPGNLNKSQGMIAFEAVS